MSVISSIEIKGSFSNNINILDCLFSLKTKIIFNNEIIIGVRDGIDIDVEYISVLNKSNKEIEGYIRNYKDLASIYLGIHIKDELHYFTFFVDTEYIVNFTIDGSRVLINNRLTDYSWYFQNLIEKLIDQGLEIESIAYEDIDS